MNKTQIKKAAALVRKNWLASNPTYRNRVPSWSRCRELVEAYWTPHRLHMAHVARTKR